MRFSAVSAEALVPATTADWIDTQQAIDGTASAVFFAGALYAFGRGPDQTLSMWSVASGGSSLGGTLASSPCATLSASGSIAVLARMQSGAIQVLFVNPVQKITTAWTTIGGSGPAFTQTPALAADGLSLLNAFSLATNGVLWTSRQTSAALTADWTSWTAIAGPAAGLSTRATGFAVFLSASTSVLAVAALGADGAMYLATQQSPGGAWGAFAPLSASTAGTAFLNGPAAVYCAAFQAPTCGALNAASVGSNNPVVCLSPPVYTSWAALPLTSPAQAPLSTSLPVMTAVAGLAQLIWVAGDGTGQTYLVAQHDQEFWYAVQSIGSPHPSFTGRMAAAVNGNAIALFQTGATLWYINVEIAHTATTQRALVLA